MITSIITTITIITSIITIILRDDPPGVSENRPPRVSELTPMKWVPCLPKASDTSPQNLRD